MCKYRGKVVLLANVAAKCGFTPQMGSLAAVQTTYKDQGLVVLGFYSDQFGQQAGSEEEQATCEQNYGVNFELFEPVNVNPPQEHEIFTWLKAQPGGAGAIDWNFEKFLLSRKGALLGRWASAVDPESDTLTTAIEAALSASP
jgi:glutathione peroxidase